MNSYLKKKKLELSLYYAGTTQKLAASLWMALEKKLWREIFSVGKIWSVYLVVHYA